MIKYLAFHSLHFMIKMHFLITLFSSLSFLHPRYEYYNKVRVLIMPSLTHQISLEIDDEGHFLSLFI